MTTICEHEREALIWALRLVCAEDDCVLKVPPFPMREQPKDVQRADNAISDPAKLAEMLAEEGCRLGLDLCCRADATIPTIEFSVSWNGWRRSCCAKDARSLLLKWLDLPDGAREEAEKVLRGENNG